MIHQSPPDFKIGKAIQLREGSDVTLLAAGGITANVMAAADRLVTHGVAARVASMHSIKPIDREYIVNSAKATGLICTIEEHNVIGGLGGAVAEVLAEMPGDRARLVRLGINDMYCSEVGTQNYLLDRLALSADGIVNQVLSLVAGS